MFTNMRVRFEISFLVIFFLVLIGACTTTTTSDDATPSPLGKEMVLEGPQGQTQFSVEIADTPEERAQGLMHRTHLGEDQGMLFVFEESKRHAFWMKNTPLSLDLIFFDNDFRVVGLIEKAEPMSEKIMRIDHDARFVLELTAGSVQKYGISLWSRGRLK